VIRWGADTSSDMLRSWRAVHPAVLIRRWNRFRFVRFEWVPATDWCDERAGFDTDEKQWPSTSAVESRIWLDRSRRCRVGMSWV